MNTKSNFEQTEASIVTLVRLCHMKYDLTHPWFYFWCTNVKPIVLVVDHRTQSIGIFVWSKRRMCLWQAAFLAEVFFLSVKLFIASSCGHIILYWFNTKSSFTTLLSELSEISSSFAIFITLLRLDSCNKVTWQLSVLSINIIMAATLVNVFSGVATIWI